MHGGKTSLRLPSFGARWSRVSKAALALVALITGTGSLNETELRCEEAVAHIQDCCPGLVADNICGNVEGFCTPVTTLSRDESDCVLALRCEDPETADVCDRLTALSEAVDDEIEPLPEVCP